MNYMNAAQVREIAPSVFAETKQDRMSDSYGFVSTVRMLSVLEEKGFRVREAMASGDKSHGYHMLRLTAGDLQPFKPKALRQVDEVWPELIVSNSHDGSAAFQLTLGIYRLWCANGAVSSNEMESIRIHHTGFVDLQLNEGMEQLIDRLPALWSFAEQMIELPLTEQQQRNFATGAASLLRGVTVADPTRVIEARRDVDNEPTLWHLFNRAQENLIRGGVALASGSRTKGTQSAAENMRLNKGVWELARDFSTLLA